MAYFGAAPALGLEGASAQTLTFVTVTGTQLLAVFNARSERGAGFRGASQNPYLWGALALTTVLETAALALPPLRDLLGLTTLPGEAWAVATALAVLPLGLIQTARTLHDPATPAHDRAGLRLHGGRRPHVQVPPVGDIVDTMSPTRDAEARTR